MYVELIKNKIIMGLRRRVKEIIKVNIINYFLINNI